MQVSIVIPTFRREQLMLEAVASVLRQQGVSFEVIVVDDSPEASARAGVEALADPRVRYLARQQPSGGRPALVRNEGAGLASGNYLYFLDDDDLLEPGALAVMVKALEDKPAAGMVFGVVTPFGDDPATLRRQQDYFREARRIALRLKSPRQLRARMVFGHPVMVCSACMGRREAIEAVGGFDATIPVCEDGDLWGRVADATDFVFLDRSVVRYRTGAPSMMHNLAPQDQRLNESYQRIQRKFRAEVGTLPALAWKVWARLVLA